MATPGTARSQRYRFLPALLLILGVIASGFYLVFHLQQRGEALERLAAHVKEQEGTGLAELLENFARERLAPGGEITPELQAVLVTLAAFPGVRSIALLDGKGCYVAHSDFSLTGRNSYSGLNTQEILLGNRSLFEVDTDSSQPRALLIRRFRFLSYEDNAKQPPPYDQRLAVSVELDAGDIGAVQRLDLWNARFIAAILVVLLGATVFFVSVLRDALHTHREFESLANYATILVDSLPTAVISLDSENRVVSVNRLAQDLFQCSEANVKGGRLDAILRGKENERLRNLIDKSLRIRQEEVIYKRGEDLLPLSLRVHEVLMPGGEAGGKVVIFEDETEILQLKEQVARSDRLTSLGRMASMIAHEVRNPLNTMYGHTQVLREDISSQPDAQVPLRAQWSRTLDVIAGEIERLNRVVSELVHFSNPVILELAPTDINAVVKETLDFMRSDAEIQGIRIEEILDSQMPKVNFDDGKLKQILLNIYLNAFDAMQNGGTLTVSTLYQPFRNRWSISIEDTGHGIKEEHLNVLFDPYFTTKSKGAGLGLSIVHNAIENLKGSIQVSSTVGQGTKFVLTFPA